MSKTVRRTRNNKQVKKNDSSQSLCSLVSDSDSDSSEDIKILLPNKKRQIGNTTYNIITSKKKHYDFNDNKYYTLEKKIKEEIKNREITIEKIFELNLPENETIWFVKQIEIRDNMSNESDEKFEKTNLIYDRYTKFLNTNWKELEKLKFASNTEISIENKILNSKHSQEVKSILYRKYKTFCENRNSNSEEYSKCYEWIQTVLDIPTEYNSELLKDNKSFNRKIIVNNAFQKLNDFLTEKIYGLGEIKEKITEAMCPKIINPMGTSGEIIVLVGPPGVGKTSIASVIAEAMDMPFDQISIGSVQDANILTGHSSTYIGATPGEFAKILIKAKRLDVLILLDEIDKIKNTQENNIASVLYHVLDKSQNNRFKDNYMPEIPLDLSKIIFLCSANDINKIDPILRDRLTIINLSGYTVKDKANILDKYLVPKFKRELDFKENEIKIDKKCLEYLISKKTKEQPGMRDSERKLLELFKRISINKHSTDVKYSFSIKGLKFPLIITEKIIDQIFS